MKKPIPPRTFETFRPPNKNYNYFENWKSNPFRAQAMQLDLVNAWWMADAALLAYAQEAGPKLSVEQVFRDTGLTDAGFAVNGISAESTQCFVVSNKEFVLVAFRGTEIDNFPGGLRDFITDLTFHKVSDGHGGKVHKGFLSQLDAIWGNLLAHLRTAGGENLPVWFTGHSLGAALATLAAERAARETLPLRVQGLYTFGSPRVGNVAFRARFELHPFARNAYRFQHHKDMVTKLPPEKLCFSYKHVDTLEYIDKDGNLHGPGGAADDSSGAELAHFISILRQAHADGTLPLPDALVDHAPIYYAVHVWNNIP